MRNTTARADRTGIGYFDIAGTVIAIEGMEQNDFPANMQLFKTTAPATPPRRHYHFEMAERLTATEAPWLKVFSNDQLAVYTNNKVRERRIFYHKGCDTPYAVAEETDTDGVSVRFLLCRRQDLRADNCLAAVMSLERLYAMEGGLLLHCAFIEHHGQAILLSGPSGIGKSTQAGLWLQAYPEARIINGDRCLLRPGGDGTYEAWEWPVAGSSGHCRRGHFPVKAIVMLEQRAGNEFISETAMTRFKRLYAQTVVNHWNAGLTAQAVGQLQAILATHQVLTYGCNMEAKAATMLHQTIFGKPC